MKFNGNRGINYELFYLSLVFLSCTCPRFQDGKKCSFQDKQHIFEILSSKSVTIIPSFDKTLA